MKKKPVRRQTKHPQWVEESFALPWTIEQKKIVERLKECALEMILVYAEIEKRINETDFPDGKFVVLGAIIKSAVICEKKWDIKNGKERGIIGLKELQKKINDTAKKLIDLLNKREKMQEDGYVISESCIDPVSLISKAGSTMAPVNRRIFFKKNVSSIFGLEHPVLRTAALEGNMPKLQEVLNVIISEMKIKPIRARHRIIDRLLISRKTKPSADFVRCFLGEINNSVLLGCLPYNFRLTPKAVAIITGCTLDINGGMTEDSVRLIGKRM